MHGVRVLMAHLADRLRGVHAAVRRLLARHRHGPR